MPRNPNKIDYSRNSPEGFSVFEILEDSRRDGHTRHYFGEIVFMAFVAIVCGMKSYESIEDFCSVRCEWFKKWLSLPNGTPSYNTFSRVIESIDPALMSQCLITHLQLAGIEVKSEQIAIAGKALRGSSTAESSHIHAVRDSPEISSVFQSPSGIAV